MNRLAKKMAAPVIVCILVVLYLAGLAFAVIMAADMPVLFRASLIVGLIALAGVMVGVAVSRMKEIRSGEEDDLSKY